MKDAAQKLPDSFYEWLDSCPVAWIRLNIGDRGVSYEFYINDENEDDEEQDNK